MGLSLESAVEGDEPASESQAEGKRLLAGRPLKDWNAAYLKVERYFNALRVGNKLLLGQQVLRVLDRAMERALIEPERAAMVLAGEEMDGVVAEWYAAVLDGTTDASDPLLRTRGRLALLLADMPGTWQDQFLKPAPWPEEFVIAMRESYLRAGPDFQISQMTPRPIDLGPVRTLSDLSNLPVIRMTLTWFAFAALLVFIFELFH